MKTRQRLLSAICMSVLAVAVGRFLVSVRAAESATIETESAASCPNPRYQSAMTFSASVATPTNVVAGDYNGDDIPDLAVFGSVGGAVLLGDGAGRLDSAGSISLPLPLTQAVSGDFNGDAIPDLAGINMQSSADQIGLMLGDGTGHFKKSFSLTLAEPTHSVAGDFNGDGRLDLLVLRQTARTIAVYPGDGAGQFGQAVTTDVTQSPFFAVPYDFNGDGKLDVAVSSESGGGISFQANDGTGRFSPLYSLAVESRPREFVVSDFNRDQIPDLAVVTSNPWQLVIYRGMGMGQFLLLNNLAAERFSRVISANINNDQLPDLLVVKESGATLYANSAAGFTHASLPSLPFNLSAGAAEDFNLDGVIDLAFSTSEFNGKVMILSAESPGQFAASNNFFVVFPGNNSSPSGILTSDAGIGDFNRDGHLDMAVPNYGAFSPGQNIIGNVSILLGNSMGGFQQITNITVGRAPRNVVVSDFNNDGKADLAVTLSGESKVVVLTGDGTGFFGIIGSYPTGVGTLDLVAADFNGDGKTDLAANGRNDNVVTVMLGDGAGFPSVTNYPAGESPLWLATGDFTGDGKLDLAVSGSGLTKVTILPGDGAGRFGAGISFTAGEKIGVMAAADFNSDGKLDLAVVAEHPTRAVGVVTVFTNGGTGQFTAGKSFELDNAINGILATDINNDAKPDLVLSNVSSIGATVLLNDGAGGFKGKTSYASLANPASISVGDFNKDGTPDLVMTTTTNYVSIVYSACSPAPELASASAASYRTTRLAAESIVAAFGSGLSTATEIANSLPLPTSLAGSSVTIKDSAGMERLAPLFFVSPNQINYLMPAGTADGTATITIKTDNTVKATSKSQIARVVPGLFTANASGQGFAAAVVVRVKADGALAYEPVTQFDATQNRFIAVPIDLSDSSEQVFLSLFGTGLRFRNSLATVTAAIAGTPAEVLYAGSQEGFAGLDQVNIRLPSSLAGRGEVEIVLTVNGKTANVVKVSIK